MPQQRSWTQYTPVTIAPGTPIPRVVAYVSKACPGIRVTQRSDLVTHRDILILEISLSPNLSFLVINIYNDSKSTALGVLTTLPLPSLPTILSGDFNLHHGLWSVNDRPPPTSPKTEALLEWTDKNRFNLINKAGEVTFFRRAERSVLDLTWANDRALKSGLLDEWQVREDLVMGSDHIPITWDLHRSPTDPPILPGATPYRFDEDNAVDWVTAYCRCLDSTQPDLHGEDADPGDDRRTFDELTRRVMAAMERASEETLK